jgi:hypothetical protein
MAKTKIIKKDFKNQNQKLVKIYQDFLRAVKKIETDRNRQLRQLIKKLENTKASQISLDIKNIKNKK